MAADVTETFSTTVGSITGAFGQSDEAANHEEVEAGAIDDPTVNPPVS